MTAYSKALVIFKQYPLVRGMVSYGASWTVSSLIQQSFEGRTRDNYDWWKCARFGLYGCFFVAPSLHTWLTIANHVWPGNTIRQGVIKTCVEMVTYGPFGMSSFYFCMSLLERKSLDEAVDEVKLKFWPTYKVAICVWPAITMVNFCFIPQRNKVPFISVCSLIWTCFLAYMKTLDKEKMDQNKSTAQLLKISSA